MAVHYIQQLLVRKVVSPAYCRFFPFFQSALQRV
jgi:hypothetical protein